MSWLSRKTNLTITRYDRYLSLRKGQGASTDLAMLSAMPEGTKERCIDLLPRSRAQLRQDIFALAQLGFPRGGYFLEFGAANGVELSNTCMLARDFGWTGILAEPARRWHDDLKAARPESIIDTRCVWKETGATLSFTETPQGEQSGVTSFVPTSRKLRGTSYDVQTVSLNDLLAEHDAPAVIDYASIDTEGSEFEILSAFDFSRHRFGVLTIEHNFAPQREELHRLLTGHGYRRVLPEISRFDDWYLSD
jgi:FkbM family methyltransferase